MGIENIRILNLTNDELHDIKFPEPIYSIDIMKNPEYNTNILRFSYTSFITPQSIFDYNMDTKIRELKKQDEVGGCYNPRDYQSERIFAEASDGTEIPISIVYKKGMIRDGKNPLLMYGYGYGAVSYVPKFDINILVLLDRGFIYAISHIRGGGMLGTSWYEQGKLLNKKNSFTDFIACAEYLINEKYTSCDKLVVKGESSGGLLMGVVVNMKPDLFKAVIANVPWMDVLSSGDQGELGTSNNIDHYYYMKSYSPYDNVESMEYPNILVTAGLEDANVAYWHAAKWIAKLRALKTDNNLLLLKTNMVAGHGGSSGRYNRLKDVAFEYAFILNALRIDE